MFDQLVREQIKCMASDELEACIQSLIDDPDAIRDELTGRIIAERGWAWYWSKLKYINNPWIAMFELDGFEATKHDLLMNSDPDPSNEAAGLAAFFRW